MKKIDKQIEWDGLDADLLYHEDRIHTATTVEEYCECKAMVEILKERILEIIDDQ